jgi:hypothetical protein
MNNSNKSKEEIIQGELAKFLVNEEYQRLICVRRGCGIAVELGSVRTHLVHRHGMKKMEAMGVVRGIRAAQWGKGWEKYSRRMPEDGSRPQEGLAVFDGVRCRFCREFRARTEGKGKEHLWKAGHGIDDDLEPVRMQSWGGKGGVDEEFWVVDEGKGFEEKSEGMSEGMSEEEEWESMSEGEWKGMSKEEEWEAMSERGNDR